METAENIPRDHQLKSGLEDAAPSVFSSNSECIQAKSMIIEFAARQGIGLDSAASDLITRGVLTGVARGVLPSKSVQWVNKILAAYKEIIVGDLMRKLADN